MNEIFNRYYPDALAMAIALVFLNGALTGAFYTHGRGGRRKLIAQVRSSGWRVGFLLLSASICVWLVIDLVRKLG
jgi:hypothetical protein